MKVYVQAELQFRPPFLPFIHDSDICFFLYVNAPVVLTLLTGFWNTVFVGGLKPGELSFKFPSILHSGVTFCIRFRNSECCSVNLLVSCIKGILRNTGSHLTVCVRPVPHVTVLPCHCCTWPSRKGGNRYSDTPNDPFVHMDSEAIVGLGILLYLSLRPCVDKIHIHMRMNTIAYYTKKNLRSVVMYIGKLYDWEWRSTS